MSKKTGSCLCGAVTLTLEVEEPVFDACHCGMCRRWAGGPGMGVHATKGLTFTGEEAITTYSSSAWAERGFCKQCGTHLFYRLKNGSFCNVTLGILDGVDDFTFKTQIYVDCKPPSYAFANRTAMMTEAEVIALFGGTPPG